MNNQQLNFEGMLNKSPNAWAIIRGNGIFGYVRFYSVRRGTLVITEARGLPKKPTLCDSPIFAIHIHGGESCTGTKSDPFSDAGTHYNPKNCPHPYHAGDMPPLFSTNGYAFSAFITNRFTVDEVIGKTVIIHSAPDDFTSQPGGNAGEKLACGVITNGNQ